MNRVCLVGRITKEPDLRINNKGVYSLRFTVAVNRNYKNEKGEYSADFISCAAFREKAELIAKHFNKGSLIGIDGHIQTSTFNKEDGGKVYLSDVIVDSIDFLSPKKREDATPEYTNDFNNEVYLDDDELPF